MPGRKTIIATAGTTAVLTLIVVGVAAAIEDPKEAVGTISLTDAHSQPGPNSGDSQQVPALDELTGVVELDGDEIDDVSVGDVDLEFGPQSWVADAGPLEDYDGDGNAESLRDELDGLVGSEVRLRVRLDDDGDDADVYEINGRTYRTVSGPAPWQSAEAMGEGEIRAAAAAAVGDGAHVVDLDAEDGSTVAWEAEVIDSHGRDHRVLLDPAGNVIDVRAD